MEYINDHMAWNCDCGCARVNLLRSGKIECDECRKIQDGEHTLNNRPSNKKLQVDACTEDGNCEECLRGD